MVRRIKGIVCAAVLVAAFMMIAPASAQQRSSVRRYARQSGGYRPLSRQQTIGAPLVQWGSHIQLYSSPFQGLPNPLQSPATFFQAPGASYQPLMGSYRPLSSGYRPTRGGYAPLSR